MSHKILIIITQGDIGGAQMSVLNLARELTRQGHDVTVGMGPGDFLPAQLATLNIPTIRFRHLRRTHNPINGMLFAFELCRLLRTNPVKVVHFNSSNALWGGWGAYFSSSKPKTLFTFRGLSLIDPNYTKSFVLRFIYRLAFRFLLLPIQEKVFVSEANLLTATSARVVTSGTVIYNGLDFKSLYLEDKSSARTDLAKKCVLNFITSDSILVGSIGRLCYQKNYEFLIRNARALHTHNPRTRIVIIGEGPARTEYENLIRTCDVQDCVALVGAIPEAHRYLAAFDLFVLSSRYEGLSITLIEALYAGLPLVVTDVGGNAETVAQGAGVTYPLDDGEKFMQAMKEILDSPERRTKLAAAAKTRAQFFSITKTAEAYLRLYKI